MLADGAAREGDWLVALAQDAGRGRQGRAWHSPAGNFFGSTLILLKPADPSPTTLSLSAGLALIEALDAVAPQAPLRLKWPNDLLLDGAKLAGILLERSADRIVAGFGVNLAIAPALTGRATASLNKSMDPKAFADLLAGSFEKRLQQWRRGNGEQLLQDWLTHAHALGTALTVHRGAEDILGGQFAGLEPDGALRLETPRGIEVIRAGDVEL